AERKTWQTHNAKLEQDIDTLRAALDQKIKTLAAKQLDERLNQLPEVLRSDLRVMLATAPDQRNAIQRYLADKFDKQLRLGRNALAAVDPALKKEVEEAEARIKALRAQQQPEPSIQALWDRGEPSPTYIYRRGDPQNPGRLVGAGVPSVLTDGKAPFV